MAGPNSPIAAAAGAVAAAAADEGAEADSATVNPLYTKSVTEVGRGMAPCAAYQPS